MIALKPLTLLVILVSSSLALSSCVPEPVTFKPGNVIADEDDQKYCELNVQKSPTDIPSQTVAILSPTNNFVDFQTLITRAETDVKNSLGGGLPEDRLKEAKGREFTVVLGDGKPRMLSKRSVQPLGDSTYDIQSSIDSTFTIFGTAYRCSAGEYKRDKDMVKSSEGTDLLKALSIAADQLTIDGPRKIFILANGIQTVGAIKMQEKGMFPKSEGSAKLLAQGLDGIGEIPDLQGAEIYWYGLGQVDGYKQELSEKASTSLESFWRQVIGLGNGKIGEICAQCGAGEPHVNSIPVETVTVELCKLIKLYEEDGVEFRPDSANFVNIKKAKSAAKIIAKQFKSKGCDEMTITGFAAAGVDRNIYTKKKKTIDKTNDSLTKKRASAFAQLVRAAGYSGSISPAGGGTCGTEWVESGSVDKDLQRLCRRVEVSNG